MEDALLKEVKVVSDADKRDIVEQIEELRDSNTVLRAENEMFERFISSLDPRDLVHQTISNSLAVEVTLESLPCLTLEQKCEIAKSEIGEMRKDMEKLKKSSEREIDHYKASLKEADIQLAEVRTERCEFEQFVKVIREKRGAMMGREVIHYMEDGIRSKDKLIEKLRLKNKCNLHQHADFKEPKIKNNSHVKRMNEVNQQYLQLNLHARDNQQVLDSYKKELHSTTCESTVLSSDIASRKKMLLKIEEETLQAEKELAKEETLNKKLRGQLENARVPDVMQYIAAKDSHEQLEKSVRAWDRKVKIAEMDLKTKTEVWKTLKRAARKGQVAPKLTHPPVEAGEL